LLPQIERRLPMRKVFRIAIVAGLAALVSTPAFADKGGKHHAKGRVFVGTTAERHQGLPPGLAKRRSLPPGLAKHVRERGSLPPGLQKRLTPQYRRYRRGHDIVVVDTRTNRIVSVRRVR
jgi:hypothetical protein